MPSQLYTNDNVEFICGRDFTYNGKDYKQGKEFPQEDFVGSPETMVRTRHVIPVVESTDVKPRHWHREVKIKSEALAKMGIKPKAEKKSGKFDPADHTVDEVLEYLTSDKITDKESERVLDAEREGKARKGILGDE